MLLFFCVLCVWCGFFLFCGVCGFFFFSFLLQDHICRLVKRLAEIVNIVACPVSSHLPIP